MTLQHSPSPLRVKSPKPSRFPAYQILDANGLEVARVQIFARNPAHADATLLAAAPELLAACEALLENLVRDSGHLGSPHVDGAIEIGRAAIAKAKGGTV